MAGANSIYIISADRFCGNLFPGWTQAPKACASFQRHCFYPLQNVWEITCILIVAILQFLMHEN